MFVLEAGLVEGKAARAAAWLAARGLGPGDRVAVVSENHPSYVPFVLGALRTGVVPVPLNVHLPGAELERLEADAGVALTIRDWPDLDGPGVDLADFPLGRPMHHTSGTTGRSKGVWSGVLSEDDGRALAADEAELWDARTGDTYLVCSPLYHSAPLRISISALLAGARVLVFERFDEAEIARAFVEERVAGAFLVPTHLRRLLAGPLKAPFARRILHAGEPCPDPLKRRAIDVFGADNLSEFLGSTEGQFTFCTSGEWLERPGTHGRARTGRTLTIRAGTIWSTAPPFARWEYWNDPDKTAASWDGDAFTVGDLGRLDDDGYLFLQGRREDLIISGGVNVYPAEVERVLLAFDGVIEAAVFGVDDEQWGQRVCAAVTGEVDAGALLAHAKATLPGSHVPKQITVLDEMPRTATGKIRRGELSARDDNPG